MSYATTLKNWRSQRRISQLELATVAAVSQRHVSFLETGRAKPSREMVIHLAIALDVPLRERNTMLAAAGYSAEYAETAFDAPALDQVRGVLETVLRSYEPFPAIVVDRGWDVVLANDSARQFTSTMVDVASPLVTDGMNAIKVVLHPKGLKPFVVNWRQAASTLLRRLDQEIGARPTDPVLVGLRDEVLTYPDVADLVKTPERPGPEDLLVPFHYRIGDVELKFFSTIATIGEAHDVTLAELRLESFLAADAETEQLLRAGFV